MSDFVPVNAGLPRYSLWQPGTGGYRLERLIWIKAVSASCDGRVSGASGLKCCYKLVGITWIRLW
jgi:hypothetical protein